MPRNALLASRIPWGRFLVDGFLLCMISAMALVTEMCTRHEIEPWTQTSRRLSHAWAGYIQAMAWPLRTQSPT
eukprot:3422132-Pyramimonas_sp.AAC.1